MSIPISQPGAAPDREDPLDRARRDWLGGLLQAHAARGDASTALALAQGYWRCGEYAAAWPRFVEARDRAPHEVDCHLALINAAGMLGRWDDEADALENAREQHPDHPAVALSAARALIPADRSVARAWLARFPDNVLCSAFVQALDIVEGRPARSMAPVAPELVARFSGLDWARTHAADVDAHVGPPARVLETAIQAAETPGLVMECGVYFGRSLDIIARRLAQPIHGFDSFQGLPEAWKPGEGAGAYSTAGRLPAVAPHVTLHPGWFDQTLPAFLEAHAGPIRLLHVDCDIYSSTRIVLEAVRDRLKPGSVIVFDDMLGYPGYQEHELKAFQEFIAETGTRWELLASCLLGREVAIRITEG